ncbi:MAG TPA: hypothetical protein VJI33_05365 [Candidatus Paceibacterota bacterium]
MTTNDESTPEYLEAVVQKKPRQDDDREIAITRKIEGLVLQEQWAQNAFSKIRELQIDYMREALKHAEDSAWIYERTQKVLEKIAELSRSKIVEGEELLEEVPKGQPVLMMTNHLGTYKLLGIDPGKELGVNIPGYDFMYPSPMYFGGLSPVAKAIGNDLSYVSDDFPGVFGKIHRASGFIHVPPKLLQQGGRTGALLEQTNRSFEARPNTAIVNYPEGGTSGKYSGLGPYDLDPFKTGGYVIAAHLNTRIIPVAQYFDPKEGLQLKVFPSYIPKSTDKAANEELAERDRLAMQDWFDKRKSS